jgi:hypothetical protein
MNPPEVDPKKGIETCNGDYIKPHVNITILNWLI